MTQRREIRVGNPSRYVARGVSGQQITRRSRGESHVLRPKMTRCSRQLGFYEKWIVTNFVQEVDIKPLMKHSLKDKLSVYGDGVVRAGPRSRNGRSVWAEPRTIRQIHKFEKRAGIPVLGSLSSGCSEGCMAINGQIPRIFPS